MPAQRLVFRSELRASREKVWQHASSMDGVNAELSPVHMRAPKGARLDTDVELGRPLMRSLVTLFRVLPIDVHELCLESVEPGHSFHERSRSLTERVWVHRRRIEARADGGCSVEDELEFEPRWFPALVRRIVLRLFERRHAYLRRRFGTLPT